jgi:hypothetical protein
MNGSTYLGAAQLGGATAWTAIGTSYNAPVPTVKPSDFSLTLPGPLTIWFGDAILIKQYGGKETTTRKNANYVSFINNTSTLVEPTWSFFKPNSVSSNVVYEVCTCTTNQQCQHIQGGQ